MRFITTHFIKLFLFENFIICAAQSTSVGALGVEIWFNMDLPNTRVFGLSQYYETCWLLLLIDIL